LICIEAEFDLTNDRLPPLLQQRWLGKEAPEVKCPAVLGIHFPTAGFFTGFTLSLLPYYSATGGVAADRLYKYWIKLALDVNDGQGPI
jgi:hypothetical protein